MAQTTQIVPKFSFPYVETVVNDYTEVTDTAIESTVDNSVKLIFAFTSGKGIDNTWVRKSSRESGVKTFGESNFKKYGQPLMQALEVLGRENSQVWMLRVMPENAAYSNSIISAYVKADTEDDFTDAHKRKFRIKLTAKSATDVISKEIFDKEINKLDGASVKVNGVDVYKDAEGYIQVPFMSVRTSGRGTYGDLYSLKLSQANTYEQEYGIKMYNFEVLCSESGLTKEANYVGTFVSSDKYGKETATLINDVLENAEIGLAPLDVRIDEDNVRAVYEEYVKFIKKLHIDLEAEYETKLSEYDIPDGMLNGTTVVTDEYKDKIKELKEIEVLIADTADSEIVDVDCFDIIFGKKVDSTEMLPCIYYPKKLTNDVDVSAPDYVAADYTTSNVVNFGDTAGIKLANGSNGYFDNPRTEIIDGESTQLTIDDEIERAYIKAYSGELDRRILSARRMSISAFFDANYPMSVKKQIVDVALLRNDCRVYLDCGMIDSMSYSVYGTLLNDYSAFDDCLISVDIHNYITREPSTNKKCNVTIEYFLAPQYVDHITNYGYHIPFVKEYAQLTGHIRDSLRPIIDECDTAIKEKLYNKRFNYFECVSENVFQRAVQNTRQSMTSDLLEESNVTVLYKLKHDIETDVQGELYNFSDESVRQSFCEFERAKYASWIGTIVQSFDITFSTSEYEFNHSILHAYIAVTFRGLNKRAIVEIDLNKRQYAANTTVDE